MVEIGENGILRKKTSIKYYRKRNHEKPLPLIPFCDQITAIKPINREEHQERLDELQAVISHSIFHQILSSNAL